MSVEELAQIVADQREEILSEDMSVFCNRDEASLLSPDSGLAQYSDIYLRSIFANYKVKTKKFICAASVLVFTFYY